MMDAGLVAPKPGSFDQSYSTDLPMNYLGGHVMHEPISVYLIWYGNWNNAKTIPIIEDMMTNVGSSDWYKINTSYYEKDSSDIRNGGKTIYATSDISFKKSIFVDESKYGSSVSTENFLSILGDSFQSGILPSDSNAQYFFLTSKGVTNSDGMAGSFCTDWCGLHQDANINGVNIKFAALGDVTQCPNDCSSQGAYTTFGFDHSPNEDWAADGMSSIILHESSEMTSDPNPYSDPTWRNSWFMEAADCCSWVFSALYLTENNSVANVKIGNRDFLIQENWVLDKNDAVGGHCGLHL